MKRLQMGFNENEVKRLLTEKDVLEKNVFDLQQELQKAYMRIDALTNELIDLRRESHVNLGRN